MKEETKINETENPPEKNLGQFERVVIRKPRNV